MNVSVRVWTSRKQRCLFKRRADLKNERGITKDRHMQTLTIHKSTHLSNKPIKLHRPPTSILSLHILKTCTLKHYKVKFAYYSSTFKTISCENSENSK